MRQVVSTMAELMEDRFAEFDGEKTMGDEDTAPYCLEKAIAHIERAQWEDDDYEATLYLIDAANRIALAIHVLENGITDEGVNE